MTPGRLKPDFLGELFGTTEVVPLHVALVAALKRRFPRDYSGFCVMF
jgi:hypothetical protein